MADTIVLNNGESFVGKIIFEDEAQYVLEVQFAKSIRDEKKFLKSDVKTITKQTADVEDFEKLRVLVPVPDLVDLGGYEESLKKLAEFSKNHPKSTKLKDVKEMQELLDQELAVVRPGGFKLSGVLVSHEDYLADAYSYDEKILVRKIQHEISRRSFIGALRLFAQFEANFADGKMREEILPSIKQVLAAYRTTLAESLEGYDGRTKDREAGLARMSLENRVDTERAINEEMAELKNRFDREKIEKNPWVTPHANMKETIIEALRQVDNEIRRLEAPSKRQPLEFPLEEVYRSAWFCLSTASAEDQKLILENAKRDRMPAVYLTKLQERLNIEK